MTNLGLGQLAKNATSTLVSRLISGVFQLISVTIIARVYGPEGNGAYAVILLLPSLLSSFLNLGIGPANVYYLGSSQFSPSKVLATNIKISFILSVLGMVIGGIIVSQKADAIFPNIAHPLLWIALCSFPVSLMQNFISSIFQGMQKFNEFNLVLFTKPLLTLVFVIILVLSDNTDMNALIAAYLVSVFLTLILSVMLLQKYLKLDAVESEDNYTKKALNYGYKAHLSNILAFVNYKADIFLVNLIMNPASAGIYVIAVQLSEKLWMLSQAVSTVLLPRLSELSNDEEKRLQITPLLTRFTLYTTALGCIVFAFIIHPLIPIIFGEEYLDVYIPLLILLPGIVLITVSRILANDLAARGKPELNMYSSIIVLSCNIIGNIVLIPIYGLEGAAIATTVAYSINFIFKILQYHYITSVPILSLISLNKNDLKKILSFVNMFMQKSVK